ncbi:MAG TPA: hypothetical protein VKT28_09690 [Puia sp.]|nr:hypothetical protein [Puia sp.]
MAHNTIEQKIYQVLRIAVAMCFIGHGAFGIITKPIWCNYFAVVGISHDLSYKMMPIVGSIDILFGIIMLAYPIRAVALWLVVWGIVTASFRPLSGEPFAEFIERAGNFGAPFVLLLLTGGFNKNIFSKINPVNHVNDKTLRQVVLSLQVIVFLLIAGHGWLNVIEKKSIIQQYTSIGFSNPHNVAITVGILEIAAAFAVLIRPARPMLFILFAWKVFSELFYPHWELFEWVERGGSYGCILALWMATGSSSYRNWINKILMNRRNAAQL